jgi:hypothetical protein
MAGNPVKHKFGIFYPDASIQSIDIIDLMPSLFRAVILFAFHPHFRAVFLYPAYLDGNPKKRGGDFGVEPPRL